MLRDLSDLEKVRISKYNPAFIIYKREHIDRPTYLLCHKNILRAISPNLDFINGRFEEMDKIYKDIYEKRSERGLNGSK